MHLNNNNNGIFYSNTVKGDTNTLMLADDDKTISSTHDRSYVAPCKHVHMPVNIRICTHKHMHMKCVVQPCRWQQNEYYGTALDTLETHSSRMPTSHPTTEWPDSLALQSYACNSIHILVLPCDVALNQRDMHPLTMCTCGLLLAKVTCSSVYIRTSC